MRTRALLVLPTLALGAVLGAVLGALLGSAPADARSTDAPVPASTAVITGHGYGHGKGLSQYGAYAHAKNGEGYRSILSFYYPHTRFGSASGKVRVWITADTDHNTIVRAATGLHLADLGSGRVYKLPTGTAKAWKLTAPTGKTRVFYRNAGVWHRYFPGGRSALRGVGEFRSTTGQLTLQIGSSYVPYRGTMRLTQGRTVNVLSLENYLRGVVPVEIFASWPAHTLRAQAVAARTYAAFERAQNATRTYQICDTSACQVYRGLAYEDSHTNAAIAATAGQVLTYRGALAFTQFSADNGGWKADGGLPYLASGQDALDTGMKYSNWSVPVDVAALQAAYPSLGTLNTLQITSRQSDGHRVANVRLTFTGGFRDVSGDKFRSLLGLKSTYFSLS